MSIGIIFVPIIIAACILLAPTPQGGPQSDLPESDPSWNCQTYIDPDTPRLVYGGGSSGYDEWDFTATGLTGNVTAITTTVEITGSLGWINLWLADPSYAPPIETDPDGKEIFYDWDGLWWWCTDHRCQDMNISLSSEVTTTLNSLAGTENWTGVYAPYPEAYPIGAAVAGDWALIYGSVGGGGWIEVLSSQIEICADGGTPTPTSTPTITGTPPTATSTTDPSTPTPQVTACFLDYALADTYADSANPNTNYYTEQYLSVESATNQQEAYLYWDRIDDNGDTILSADLLVWPTVQVGTSTEITVSLSSNELYPSTLNSLTWNSGRPTVAAGLTPLSTVVVTPNPAPSTPIADRVDLIDVISTRIADGSPLSLALQAVNEAGSNEVVYRSEDNTDSEHRPAVEVCWLLPWDYGTPTPVAWITEILARPTADWNLRGGAGNDDQFVELGTHKGTELGNYEIVVYDNLDIEKCQYTLSEDNYHLFLKAYWQDYMETTAGDKCGQWPETGYVKVYGPTGALIDTRTYDYAVAVPTGKSWASSNWRTPSAPFAVQTPSPGTAW